MKTNNTFSFSRLLKLMKREIIENKRQELYSFISMYGAFLLVYIVQLLGMDAFEDGQIQQHFDIYAERAQGITIFMANLTFIIYASRFSECINTKEKRMAYLMVPATKGEKFASRAIFILVISFATITISAFLADLTRLLLTPLFKLPDIFNQLVLTYDIPNRVNELTEDIQSLGTISGYSFLVCCYSLFTLGGSYFYKHPLLKTFVSLVVIHFVAGTVIYSVMKIFYTIEEIFINEAPFQANDVLIFIITFSTVISILCWILAYHFFSRAQTTERKLF